MTILQLRALAHSKRAEAKRILDGVTGWAETRDMSPEENAKFDKLMGEVETIKGQVAKLEAIEAAEGEEPMGEPEGRSAPAAPARRSAPIGEAPAAHTERRTYSILRAVRAAVNGRVDGLEGELSREMSLRSDKTPKGFFVPLGSDPEIRALMAGARKAEVRADLTTSTGAGAVFTSAELPIIDLLRAKLVVKQLGAKVMTGMKGAFAIPRQSGSSTVYWLAEGSGATASAQAIDQVAFTPLVALALTNISRKFLLQSSPDAEQFVRDDLAATLAHEWDRVALNGNGTNQPTGILQNSGIATLSASVQGGTNGAALTFAQIVNMESLVAANNADMGALAYLTSPSQRGKLKQVATNGAASPFVWTRGDVVGGPGEVNGYNAYASSVIPANLTKGTASGTASAIIFGNWNDLVVASFDDAVDFLVNPYTLQSQGAVTVSLEMAIDAKVRHNESFAAITDAL